MKCPTDTPQVIGATLPSMRRPPTWPYPAVSDFLAQTAASPSTLRTLSQKEMLVPEYRHRSIIWGVQSQYYTDFLPWLQNCWGILPLVDMLSLVYFDEVSEDDPEQAIYDIAKLYQEMIMRNRTHGGYEVLLDDLWRFCDYYNADMVILWEHICCKALLYGWSV